MFGVEGDDERGCHPSVMRKRVTPKQLKHPINNLIIHECNLMHLEMLLRLIKVV